MLMLERSTDICVNVTNILFWHRNGVIVVLRNMFFFRPSHKFLNLWGVFTSARFAEKLLRGRPRVAAEVWISAGIRVKVWFSD